MLILIFNFMGLAALSAPGRLCLTTSVGILLLIYAFSSSAAPGSIKEAQVQSQEAMVKCKDARERMKNRARLQANARKRPSVVPLTPEQKKRDAAKKLVTRGWNREQLAMHTRWRPGQIGSSERLLPLTTEALMTEMASPHVEAAIHKVVQRLKLQLGKPYVWGGQMPEQGFDCSGLVYYAFNHFLNRKLPRTADGMFQDRTLKHIDPQHLQRGDLVFFSIKRQNKADHVGVYLGGGQFIEAPRTGLKVRVSQLADNYWQEHFLGAKRILTEEAILPG